MAALKKFGAAFVALRECARAVERGDLSRADLSMKRALDLAEDDNERLVTYFAQALARRAYRLLPKYPPVFKFCCPDETYYSYTPLEMIEGTIGKAASSGKSRLHLIFFSLNFFDEQTESYMQKLKSSQRVTQLSLKITLVDTSNSGYSTAGFDSKFDYLRYRAKGIDFEFNRIVIINNSLDELEVSRLKIDRDDEFVVVNCFLLLGYMLPVALNKFLLMLRNGINPDILFLAECDANLNQDDFLQRFDESLQHYSNLYSSINANYIYDNDMVHHFRNEICNVVACEGGARVVRHMTSHQWRNLLNKYGFSSIPVPYNEERIYDNDDKRRSDDFDFKIENGCMKIYDEGQERPIFFISALEINESSFDEDFYHNSSDGDDIFRNLPISPDPQHRSLIRMASLAEIHDMTYRKLHDYEADYDYLLNEILVWGKCEDNHNDGRSSQLNHCLCIVDHIESGLPTNKFPKYHLQERNYVTKTFESNQPCFVPNRTYEEKDLSIHCAGYFVNGAFAIMLDSLFDNCEGYVVQFLFGFPVDTEDEEKITEMGKILWDLRYEKSSFVTCPTTYDFLDRLEATLDAVRIINNPSVQSQSHNNVMDSNVPWLRLPHQSSTVEVSDARGELFLPYGSSTPLAKPTRDQNLPVDSSTRNIDLNDELSLDNWLFGNPAVGDDMDVQVSSLDKEQEEALKNVHPPKPNASEDQRDFVKAKGKLFSRAVAGKGKTVFQETIPSDKGKLFSRAVAEKGKTVFQETIPIDKGKLFSKRQFQVGMSFTTCGRTGNDSSPSWGKATTDERLKALNFTYGADGSVKPKMAKPPAVISNSKAQCSSSLAYERRMFRSQTITKERKPTWSKKNVREYLICPFTSEEENKLTAQRRLKPSGKTVTKVDIWDIKDKSLAPLVYPLDNIIVQKMPENFYIDDTVIDAYFQLLRRRCDTYPNKYLKHHSFSCFIASKLFSGQAEDLSTWFDPKDLKDACKLFLPLCLPIPNHWVLLCVDINNRQFLWLDSLENSRRSHKSEMRSEMRVILKWFVESVLPHLDNKDASKWKVNIREDIPTQKNTVDCGVFVMKYADCLTHGDCFPFSQDDMLHFRRRIFLDIAEWSVRVPHRFIISN